MKDLVCYCVACVFKFEFVFGFGFVLLCFLVQNGSKFIYFIVFNSVFFYLVKIDKLFLKKLNADVAFFIIF